MYQQQLRAEQAMRAAGRGGMLDKGHRETGLQARISLGEQVDVLQLTSVNQANPCVVTVGVDVRRVANASANGVQVIDLKTVLTWGTGKGRSSAIVDTRNGAQITLSANILNVAVHYVAPAVRPVGSSEVYIVSGSVAYGDRPGASNPALTFTTPEQILVVAANAQLEIPKYATAVAWVNDGDPTTGTAPVGVLRFRGGLIGASVKIVSQALVPASTFVPIPNGAHVVDILNGSPGGAPATGFRLIYEIGL